MHSTSLGTRGRSLLRSAGRAGTELESLERRTLLAAVAWDGNSDGDGDGVNWHDPLNWSNNLVPTSVDDVTINVATNPTIQFTATTGNRSVNSLVTAEAITFTGGQLNVGTTATLQSGAVVTNNGATIAGGAWNVTAGTLRMGATSANLLSGVAITGDLLLDQANSRTKLQGATTFTTARLQGSGSSLGFAPGMTVSGNILFEGASGTRFLEMNGAGAVTLNGNVTLVAGSACNGHVGGNQWFGGAMTLTSNGIISADGSGTLSIPAVSTTNNNTLRVQNDGTLTVNNLLGNANTLATTAAASVLTISDGTYTLNSGLTIAQGVITLDGAWNNTGTLAVNGGTLNLGGAFTTAEIGAFIRGGGGTAGTVNLIGALDNTGNTLALNASKGTWNLGASNLPGSITGGSLTQTGGFVLGINAVSNNLLQDVAISGDLVISVANGRTRIGGTTTFATARLQGTSSSLAFAPGSIVASNIIFEGAVGTRFIESNGPGALTLNGNVTLAAGSTCNAQIGGSQWYGSAMTLTTNGIVSADGSGTLSIPAGSTTNNNTMRAQNDGTLTVGTLSGNANTLATTAAASVLTISGGTYTLNSGLTIALGAISLAGAWNNAGTIAVNGGTLSLGGTFTTAAIGTFTRGGGGSAGTVNLTGALDNTGNTLALNTTKGTWNLGATNVPGSITGGSLTQTGGFVLGINAVTNNLLQDLNISGDLVISAVNGRTRIGGTTTFTTARLQASNSTLAFVPGAVVNGNIIFEGTVGTRFLEMNGAGAVTLNSNVTLAAGSTCNGQIGGSQWYGGAMTLTSNGIVSADGSGTLSIPALSTTSNSTLRAQNDGTLTVSNLTGSANTLATTAAASVLTISGGTYTLNAGLTIAQGTITLGGTWNNTGTIAVNGGTLNLGGTFNTAAIGTFTRGGGGTAGTVNITGALNNTGGTLVLNASKGTWNLGLGTSPGSITGGSLTQTSGFVLGVNGVSNNLLQDVAISGDLVISVVNGRTKIGGTTSFTTARLQAAGTSIGFLPGAVVGGSIIFEGASGTRFLEMNGTAGSVTLNGNVSTAAGSAGNAQVGGSGQWYGGTMTLTANGVISADGSGTLSVLAASTTSNNTLRAQNNGTLTVSNLVGNANTLTTTAAASVLTITGGTYTLNSGLTIAQGAISLGGAWSNAGTIAVNGGTLNLGGTFTTAGIGAFTRGGAGTAGTVNITGALDNTGGTLTLNSTKGTWNLGVTNVPGSITGGSVTQAGGFVLAANAATSNLLQNVAISGELVISVPNGRTRIGGTTTFTTARLQASSASLGFAAGATIPGNIIAEGTSGTRFIELDAASGTLLLPAGRSISVAAGSTATIQISAGLWYGGVMTFTNDGTLAAASGSLAVSATATITNYAAGVLTGGAWLASGTGTVNLNRVVTQNDATVGVGDANSFPSLVTLAVNNGTLSGRGGGTFNITPLGGTFANNGTVTAGPGNNIHIIGDVAIAPAATINIELGGTAISQFGRLTATGAIAADGTLNVSYANGFIANFFDRFEMISGATVTGQFAFYALPAPEICGKQHLFYTGSSVDFVASHTADFNNDGTGDFFDYLDFVAAFAAEDLSADFNGDETIDFFDYLDFASKFDQIG